MSHISDEKLKGKPFASTKSSATNNINTIGSDEHKVARHRA